MRSAPMLKIWITPFSSVAMLEKLTLLKMAFCRATVLSSASGRPVSAPVEELLLLVLCESGVPDASMGVMIDRFTACVDWVWVNWRCRHGVDGHPPVIVWFRP